jgi:Tfp pilus assembly protein PilX
MKIQTVLRNEQGIALVMALIVMVTLAALIGVLAILATSEPQIADNQLPSAQARALAESGLQRALWALSTGQTSPTRAAY